MVERPTRGQLTAALADTIPNPDAVAANRPATATDEPQPQAVRIPFPDGELFDIATPNDLSMAASEQFRRLWIKLMELRGAEGDDDGLLSDAQMAELSAVELKMACIAVPDAPREAVATLSARRRGALIHTFLEGMGILQRIQAAVQRINEARQSQQDAPAETPQPASAPRSKRTNAPTTKRSQA